MSILEDAYNAHHAAQKAAGMVCRDCGQHHATASDAIARDESLEIRLEFFPTASREENHRSGQRAAILARLRFGPAPTWELNHIGGSGFSSRIAEPVSYTHLTLPTNREV